MWDMQILAAVAQACLRPSSSSAREIPSSAEAVRRSCSGVNSHCWWTGTVVGSTLTIGTLLGERDPGKSEESRRLWVRGNQEARQGEVSKGNESS